MRNILKTLIIFTGVTFFTSAHASESEITDPYALEEAHASESKATDPYALEKAYITLHDKMLPWEHAADTVSLVMNTIEIHGTLHILAEKALSSTEGYSRIHKKLDIIVKIKEFGGAASFKLADISDKITILGLSGDSLSDLFDYEFSGATLEGYLLVGGLGLSVASSSQTNIYLVDVKGSLIALGVKVSSYNVQLTPKSEEEYESIKHMKFN